MTYLSSVLDICADLPRALGEADAFSDWNEHVFPSVEHLKQLELMPTPA